MEKEHSQYLRDSQRNEDRSAIVDPTGNPLAQAAGPLDFQSLVSGGTASTGALAQASNLDALSSPVTFATNGTAAVKPPSWEDDVWGSILDGAEVCVQVSGK